MKNVIVIDDPILDKNRIIYHYTVSGLWEEVFNATRKIEIQYSINMSSLPKGIAIIPFLANVLPMAWIYNAEIIIRACDKTFYDSIPEFKKGYQNMYPMMTFNGKLTVEKLEKNHNTTAKSQSGAFFSGGVDAFNTLVCHEKEKPILLTLWGADIKLKDEKGWKNVLTHLQKVSQQFGIDYVTIKSEFRIFQNEGILTRAVNKSGDGWGRGFQHGIGIICHAAPVAWALGLSTIYFASSFTAADRGKVTCASDPTIDNFVRFGETRIIHDGYQFTRQMKVHNITQFAEKNDMQILLRVCWESAGGSNCCQCEKCWRTILAIYAEKQDPHAYGFEYTDKQLDALAKKMRYSSDGMFGELRYNPIQQAMHNNCKEYDLPNEIRWFYDADLHHLGEFPLWIKICKKITTKIKGILGEKNGSK